MTRNLLLIAGLSITSLTQATAQNSKTVVVENKKVATTRQTCTEAQSNQEFYEFFNHLKEHNGFDSEKLREAEMAVTTECFTSHQIRVTITGFTYEETRIKFAKFAYKYAFDKDKYATIKPGFNSADSWDEVNEYVSKK